MTTQPTSAEGALLQQLLGAMSKSWEELPPHLRELLDEHSTEDHRLAGKTAHKLVSAQTTARRELAQVRSSRREFLAQWTAYTTKLCQTWEAQLKEKAQFISDFDAAEEKWNQQLQDTSRELARFTASGAQTVESVEDSDEELMASEAMVDDEIQKEMQRKHFQEQMAAREQEISRNLQAATTAAKEQEDFLARADRERSSRRRQDKEAVKEGLPTKDAAKSKSAKMEAEAKASVVTPPG